MTTTVQVNSDGSLIFSVGDGTAITQAHAPAGANHDHVQHQLAALKEANLAAAHNMPIAHPHGHAANDTAVHYQFPQGAAIAAAQAPQGANPSVVAQQLQALGGLNQSLSQAVPAQAGWANRVAAQAPQAGHAM